MVYTLLVIILIQLTFNCLMIKEINRLEYYIQVNNNLIDQYVKSKNNIQHTIDIHTQGISDIMMELSARKNDTKKAPDDDRLSIL